MADIFVSYKSTDRERVAPIVALLETRGWSVWWDTRIGAGETWDEVIERELETANCVVVVWSIESIGSRWVRAEASEGLERGILVPVHIDVAKPPLEFKLIQSIDLSAWRDDVVFPAAEALISAVGKLLGLSSADKARLSPSLVERIELPRVLKPDKSADATRNYAPAAALTRRWHARTTTLATFLGIVVVVPMALWLSVYWKAPESRGEASRSAESAITQVQSALFAASTRLEQLQSTLDQLTTISSEKAVVERDSGKSCPNSGPGDGPRRKMREDDAGRFKFASDFVKGRIGTVKSDMAALDGDLQKIVKDDRSVIDARTGNRNEFLRGVGRKLDLTVTGFNAFRSDPQLKQIRIDLADRAEKTTLTGAKGIVISCPDAQLQMALRDVVRAIDQLPELERPKIAGQPP